MKKRKFILEQHRSKDTSQSISSILKLLGVIGIANVMTAFLTFSDFSFLSTLYNLEVGNILRFHPFIKSNPTYFIFILSTWNIMLLISFLIITYAWFAFSDLFYAYAKTKEYITDCKVFIFGVIIFVCLSGLLYWLSISSNKYVVGAISLLFSLLIGLIIRILFKNLKQNIFTLTIFLITIILICIAFYFADIVWYLLFVLTCINWAIAISYDETLNLSYRSKKNLAFYTAIAFVTVLIFAFFCSLSSDGWKRLDDTKMTVGFLSTKFLLDTKKELVVTNELDENITIHKNGDTVKGVRCPDNSKETAIYASKYINSPLDDKIFWYFEDIVCKDLNLTDSKPTDGKVYIVSTEDNKTKIVAVGNKQR